MRRLLFSLGTPWYAVYEDGNEGEGGGGGDDAATKAAAEKAAADKTARFSQEQVNTILADDRRKHKAANDKLIAELQQLKKNSSLSEQEKTSLQARIEELQSAHLTAKEKAEIEKKRLETEHKSEKETLIKKADQNWNLYSGERINNAILREIAQEKITLPEVFLDWLSSRAKLVEDLNEEGKPTGSYTPKVSFKDEKEGNPITLELTIPEAVKRMKELPDRFGHLFHATAQGGAGANGGVGGGGKGNSPPTDPEQYRVWRAKNKHKVR